MKYFPLMFGSLLVTGSALSTVCIAQDEAAAPVPQASATEREQAARSRATADEESRISERVKSAMEKAQVQLERVQAQAPGLFYSTQYTPEMAKKTREITVLRQMVALKLSARDLERAIPLLKQLRDTDKVVPAKPEQALDEEYNALLHAKPGDPMPPSSAQALRDASRTHREEKQAIWDSMQKAIGREKTTGIRQMLRSESFSSVNAFSLAAPTLRAYSNRGNVVITGPDGKIIERRRTPSTAQPATPPDTTIIPAVPAVPAAPDKPAAPPRRRSRNSDATPANPDSDSEWIARGAAGQGWTSRLNNLFMFNSGQVSLDELIDLMEKKLAAMK